MLRCFKNLEFSKKILIICLLVSFVPVFLLGIFCYHQVTTLLLNREKDALTETLLQESNNLNVKITDYENAMQYVLWNNNIIQALSNDYNNNADMFLTYRDTIDPLFTNIKSLYTDIINITLYTDITIHPHGSILRPLVEIQDCLWYKAVFQSTRPIWITSMTDQTLALVCRMLDVPAHTVTIVKMDFDYRKAFSSMDTLYEQSYGVLLTDGANIPIYQFYTFPEDQDQNPLVPEQLTESSLFSKYQDDYVIESVAGICHDWKLFLYRPIRIISEPAQIFLPVILLIILLCLAIVILASSFLSHMIVRPLKKLEENMQLVEQGNYTVSITADSSDEIGYLIESFTRMVDHINHLINEVLNEKVLQQKYEMQALRAQVNPHFLYNSLSLINSKAILNDQKEISEIALFLSSFYRTALSKEETLVPVRKELENIRSYINIQSIMHSHSFDTNYDIEEEILSCTMPNLLLQPLVENAILHGIDYVAKPERGQLTITGCQMENTLVFRISDNGPGIPLDKLSTLLTADSKGYGVRSVHKRVQLLYGEHYGLQYKSAEEKGTTVTLTVPIKPIQ